MLIRTAKITPGTITKPVTKIIGSIYDSTDISPSPIVKYSEGKPQGLIVVLTFIVRNFAEI